MQGYDPATYGDRFAEIYDTLFAAVEPGMIDRLGELAGNGPALELGIGTGRVALPLLERGVAVAGVDASDAILAKLKAKPRGNEIPAIVGDFSEVLPPGPFSLVYVIFNTFFGLTTQDAQVRCMRAVAKRLAPGGSFLLECFVPDVKRLAGQQISVGDVELQRIRFDAVRYEPIAQTITGHHVFAGPDGVKLYPLHLRYVWPAELDLMAALAGLALADRWSGWNREPFGPGSPRHISIYERAQACTPIPCPGDRS